MLSIVSHHVIAAQYGGPYLYRYLTNEDTEARDHSKLQVTVVEHSPNMNKKVGSVPTISKKN